MQTVQQYQRTQRTWPRRERKAIEMSISPCWSIDNSSTCVCRKQHSTATTWCTFAITLPWLHLALCRRRHITTAQQHISKQRADSALFHALHWHQNISKHIKCDNSGLVVVRTDRRTSSIATATFGCLPLQVARIHVATRGCVVDEMPAHECKLVVAVCAGSAAMLSFSCLHMISFSSIAF